MIVQPYFTDSKYSSSQSAPVNPEFTSRRTVFLPRAPRTQSITMARPPPESFSPGAGAAASFHWKCRLGSQAEIGAVPAHSGPQESRMVPPTPGLTSSSRGNHRLSSPASVSPFHTAWTGAAISISYSRLVLAPVPLLAHRLCSWPLLPGGLLRLRLGEGGISTHKELKRAPGFRPFIVVFGAQVPDGLRQLLGEGVAVGR